MNRNHSYPFCIAPMMGYSHGHFIAFMRLLTRHGLIFTQMLPADAVCVNPERMCDWQQKDFPIAAQLGGSDAQKLALASRIISDYGASEINLNMGCPSPRVRRGEFGASLMCRPEHSAALIDAMQAATSLPVTVKLRIGVDEQDSEEELHRLIHLLQQAGAKRVYLHARKAWLHGLNPKQNREIPPLRYDVALRCKQQFPDLPFILNGGIDTLAKASLHQEAFDGVMVGRAAIQNPFAFRYADRRLFSSDESAPSRAYVFDHYRAYIEEQLTQTHKGSARYLQKSRKVFLLQPLFAMLHGHRGAKQWRHALAQIMHEDAPLTILDALLPLLQQADAMDEDFYVVEAVE